MVKVGFTRKKVESMTLGEKLKKIRSEYRISLSEVSKQTKIQMKYLEYLENGEYEKLPAEVYVRGFVRSYAHFLGTDEMVLVKLYEQERHIQKNLKKDHFKENSEAAFHFPHFIITPKLFIITGVLVVALGGFAYLYNEFQSFAAVPQLTITEPFDGAVISSREVYIRGNTEKDASVSINGQPVLVRENGEFYEQVHLQSGLNSFSVTAVNKFKKEKAITLSVQSNYEVIQDDAVIAPGENNTQSQALQSQQSTQVAPSKQLRSKLIMRTEKTISQVKLVIDGAVVFDGELKVGIVKEFDIQKEYTISTSDAKHTLIGIDDQLMSPVDVLVQNVVEKNIILPSSAPNELDASGSIESKKQAPEAAAPETATDGSLKNP